MLVPGPHGALSPASRFRPWRLEALHPDPAPGQLRVSRRAGAGRRILEVNGSSHRRA